MSSRHSSNAPSCVEPWCGLACVHLAGSPSLPVFAPVRISEQNGSRYPGPQGSWGQSWEVWGLLVSVKFMSSFPQQPFKVGVMIILSLRNGLEAETNSLECPKSPFPDPVPVPHRDPSCGHHDLMGPRVLVCPSPSLLSFPWLGPTFLAIWFPSLTHSKSYSSLTTASRKPSVKPLLSQAPACLPVLQHLSLLIKLGLSPHCLSFSFSSQTEGQESHFFIPSV